LIVSTAERTKATTRTQASKAEDSSEVTMSPGVGNFSIKQSTTGGPLLTASAAKLTRQSMQLHGERLNKSTPGSGGPKLDSDA
jgi:hypothetical protein